MNKVSRKVALFLAALCLTAQAEVQLPHHRVRAAFILAEGMTIPSDFLDRARQNGYNYILAHFGFYTFHWSVNGSYNASFVNEMKAAFLAVDAKGMRLIPLFQFGTKHASEGLRTVNTHISWNIVGTGPCPGKAPVACPATLNFSHAFAADPPGTQGVDHTYKQLLTGIKAGFDAAKLRYPLEYVHLGHDEPTSGWGLHPQDTVGTPPHRLDDTLILGNSPVDSLFLASIIGKDTTQAKTEYAFESLLADELSRRVRQADSILGHDVKIMVWGDAYDPQHAGGIPMPQLFNDKRVRTRGAILRVPASQRPRLVLMPWMYPSLDYPYWQGNDYNTDSTFEYFKGAGYTFVYAHEVGDSLAVSPWQRLQLSEEIATAAKPAYRSHNAGFCSVHWRGWTRPPWVNFRSLEYNMTWSVHQASVFD